MDKMQKAGTAGSPGGKGGRRRRDNRVSADYLQPLKRAAQARPVTLIGL